MVLFVVEILVKYDGLYYTYTVTVNQEGKNFTGHTLNDHIIER